ncbi:MAG: AarF/ABC1/UbiB kinase family protein, partial [Planctomycetales bacterium]|nr:AarF/ABC1/UbiB kinase family protein [Planctomycetales bacterium]
PRRHFMRITAIPQIYRNVNRWGEILSILSKYGLAGWISRLGFRFGKGWLKNRNGQALAHMSRAERVRLAFEELGPTFIKLGQVLSTRPDLVGAELASELEELQTNVAADPGDVARSVVEEELGRPIEEVFSEFDDVPVASASIGQVHRARLKTGQRVAVKVQHRDILHRVRVDLDILSGLAQLAERVPDLTYYRPAATVAEFQRTLRKELDFQRELRHLEEFRRALAENEHIRLPRPYGDLSTSRVLVMEWLDGTPLSAEETSLLPKSELTDAARHGAEIYLEMIFTHGLYHADPHPGNLLLMNDARIGLLDFGMVGRIDDSLREQIEDLLAAIVEQDGQRLASTVVRVGSTPTGLDESALNVDLVDFTSHYANQPVDRFELAAALTEMLDLIRRHEIVLPAAITMLLKVLVMLEGTGRRLAPDFSLMEVLKPFRKKIVARRLSPSRQLRKARRMASEFEQLAETLPRRLRDLMQQVETGKFDVHLDHRGLEPSVNRLVLGMLTSALFLGSVLLVTHNVMPLNFWPLAGMSAPGLVGVSLSLALGIRLLRAINKSGHLDRRR